MAKLKPVSFLIFTIVIFFFIEMMMAGCANIVPPSGGVKDTTAPILTAISPIDSQLNTKVKRITLHFNKFVEIHDLARNMQLSPLLEVAPTVVSYGKRVEIKLVDSLLKPNTTYIISLGNSIVDNRESNPFPNFKYTFSTGSYFDSLSVKGNVIDAETGLPDTSSVILLYPFEDGDSAVLKKRPTYVGKVNHQGHFEINSLPQKKFNIYALVDNGNDYLYNPDEDKIGFVQRAISPKSIDDTSSLAFYVFKQKQNNDTSKTSTINNNINNGIGGRLNNRKNNIKSSLLYQVNVDTSDIESRTQEITQPINITLNIPLSEFNKRKVYLSYDANGVEVEAISTKTYDSLGKILIQPDQWEADKIYTLRLVKGWAKDTTGSDLLPSKYQFRTKRNDDYGLVRVHLNPTLVQQHYLLYVYSNDDTIALLPIKDSVMTLSLLKPGMYNMRLIKDENNNGHWDTGNLLQNLQPEKVYPYLQTINIRAGWENDIDFNPTDK